MLENNEKELLDKTLKLSEENNLLLKKMERQARWGRIFSIVRIVIYVLPFVLAYFYLMPFIQKIADIYSSFSGTSHATSTLEENIKALFGN